MTDQELQTEINRLKADNIRMGVRILSTICCLASSAIGAIVVAGINAGRGSIVGTAVCLLMILFIAVLPEQALRVKK